VISFLIVLVFYSINVLLVVDYPFISSINLEVRFIIIVDKFRVIFLTVVLLISRRVFLFSRSYIKKDKIFSRFHFLLISFVLSMVLLILSPNLFRILLGWDGLGVSSYLLVIYYRRKKSYNSGIITFLSNRIGDALIISTMANFLIYPSLVMIHFSQLNIFYVGGPIFVVLASFTKRAQIPFRAWLPMAIAAPTPVSSLVHSSTLVTAGVYLIFRFEIFIREIGFNRIIIFFGAITILIARMAAFSETDMKKMVALSTLRQLGIMITAIGVGFGVLAFFHLLTHAFFKALLFIGAGNLIHASERYQDRRVTGGLTREIMPLTTRTILLSSIRLCGLPFIAAFYSKEIIIEMILINSVSFYSYVILCLGISITVTYSLRLLVFSVTFFERQRGLFIKHDLDFKVNLSIILLIIPAVTGGRFIITIFEEKTFLIVSFHLKLIRLGLIIAGVLTFGVFSFYGMYFSRTVRV